MDGLAFTNTISPVISPHSNGTTTDFGFHDEWQRILLAVLLLLASITGTIGNSLTILAVILSRKLRSPTNVFVVNLSVADLLTCLGLPWNIVSLLSFNGWPHADWVCTFAAIVTYVPIFTSVFTLASVAINRLLIITQPIRVYKKVFCNQGLISWIILLWLCPFVVAVMPPLVWDFGSLGYNDKFHSCSSVSSHKWSNKYDLYTAVIIYPIPLVIITACYMKIFIHVRYKQKKISQHKLSNLRSGTEDSVSLSSIDDSSLPPSPSQISPTHHSQFSFPDHQKYVRNKTPPTSPLALKTTPSPLSWPLPTRLNQNTHNVTGNGRPTSSPVMLTKTAAIKLAEELAETEPSALPRSNSNGRISSTVSNIESENSTGNTLLERWPRAMSASDSSLNTIGTCDRPLSCLPPSRTAAARLTSRSDSNSLPARRGRPASLTSVTVNRNNSFPLHSKAKDDAPVVLRRSRKLGRSLSKRIRNTIIEARVRISKRQLAITKNMFYVVIAFAICFTPFVFCLLIDTQTATTLLPYSAFLIFFNACINPTIYATKHPYFKKVLSKILSCKWNEIPEPSDALRYLINNGCCKSK